jgi:hypothetical protein
MLTAVSHWERLLLTTQWQVHCVTVWPPVPRVDDSALQSPSWPKAQKTHPWPNQDVPQWTTGDSRVSAMVRSWLSVQLCSTGISLAKTQACWGTSLSLVPLPGRNSHSNYLSTASQKSESGKCNQRKWVKEQNFNLPSPSLPRQSCPHSGLTPTENLI